MLQRVSSHASRVSRTTSVAPLASSSCASLASPSVAVAAASSSSAAAFLLARRPLTTTAALSHRLVPRPFKNVPLHPGLPRTIRWVSPPSFNALLKKFVMQVHPDVFGDAPEQQHVNQASLQQLNAFVASLKSKEDGATYPPVQKLNLVFYLKKRSNDAAYYAHSVTEGRHLLDPAMRKVIKERQPVVKEGERIVMRHEERARRAEQKAAVRSTGEPAKLPTPPTRGEIMDGEFHILPVRLSTNGTLCKHSLARQFRSAFLRAGIEGAAAEFTWDAEYWKHAPPKKMNEAVKEAQKADATAAPAS